MAADEFEIDSTQTRRVKSVINRSFKFSSRVAILAGVACLSTLSRADVTLPKIIGDHMILQRGTAAPIWGKAAPGEKISIRGDWQSNAVVTTADKKGNWLVKIPVPAPGAPHSITIEGKNKIVLSDVLIGEVWICSGQSNMEMPVGDYGGGYSGVTNWQEELSRADIPEIRLFTVENSFALSPQFDCRGNWSVCDSNSARAFSAVGFFFGRELHEKLKVPIGLISADFGGTVCEAWTSEQTLKNFPDFTNTLASLERARNHPAEAERENAAKISAWTKKIEPANGSDTNAAFDLDDSSWAVAQNLGGGAGDIQLFQGFVTFRKAFELPAGWINRDLILELGPVDDMDFTFFNGAKVGQTVGELTWSQPRIYSISKSLLKPGKNILTVCVLNTGGPGGIGGPVRLHPDDEKNSIALDHDWRYRAGVKNSDLPQLILPSQADANSPSVLFNAMISPLIPFGIRGAIWYQGESNIGRDEQYRRLFPAMIADWRRHWGEGDFPFYFVQIAPFHYPNVGLSPALREAQMLSMRAPNTGMAVTMDSDSYNLHPKNKQPVGHRLALWARAKTYGETNLIFSGPIYRAMKIEGDKIRLFFDYVGGGLVANGKSLEHFVIAGADGKFVPARAEIDRETIVVSADSVKRPVVARYAWADGDESSFGNVEGLPASPFRTDAPQSPPALRYVDQLH
jgi:sialate O-acetylesterase